MRDKAYEVIYLGDSVQTLFLADDLTPVTLQVNHISCFLLFLAHVNITPHAFKQVFWSAPVDISIYPVVYGDLIGA